MRHRRPPTCTNCYAKGHTRRGCPAIKEKAALAAAKPESDRSWSEQRAIDAVNAYKQESANRSCAYCSYKGHNARGCPTRKGDINLAVSDLISFRKKLLASLKKCGVGLGAIVSYNGYYNGHYAQDNKSHFLLIRGWREERMVTWEYNQRERTCSFLKVKGLSDLDNRVQNYDSYIPAPVQVLLDLLNLPTETVEFSSYDRTKIESPSNELGIDEASFLSYVSCYNAVLTKFEEKRGNKVINRSTLIYEKVFTLPE